MHMYFHYGIIAYNMSLNKAATIEIIREMVSW